MSTSIFRRKNKEVVGAHIDRLVCHLTGMTPEDENFEIAQRFIWNKFENNNFADTNENAVERQYRQLQEKLVIHTQDERARRLKYLLEEFKKRKTFKQVGISDTHMCCLQLLMCLSVNPTGASGQRDAEEDERAGEEQTNQYLLAGKFQDYGIGGVHDDLPSTKLYPDQHEIERLNQEKFENDLKELQNSEEMNQIKIVKRQWERELQAEEGDSSSYYEEDDRGTDSLEEELDEQKVMNEVNYKKDHEMQDQQRVKPKRSKKPVKIFKDQQVLFGGLPITNEIKVPTIKSVDSLKFKRTGRSQAARPKKFSLNQFLDQFLDEQQSQSDSKLDDEEKLIKDEKLNEFRIRNQEIQDQHDLKQFLNIRTFDEIQNNLSDRLLSSKKAQLANPLLVDHGASQLYKNRSCMREPMNLNRDLNKALNPYSMVNKSSHLLTTERRLVLDILQMLSQPSLESDTFVRDRAQLGVLFKLRNDGQGFNLAATLSHLSQGAVRNVLNKFLQMGNDLQKTCFLFRGIQTNSERLSTVIQSLIFAFDKILDRFNYEISDLTQILLLQAGQISKSQIALSPLGLSRVTVAFPQYMEIPLTLMKLEHILDQQGLFSKIMALKGIMEKGILDYVAHCHSNEAQRQIKDNQFFVEKIINENQNPEQDLMDSFLKLADNFADDDKKNDPIEEQDAQEGQDENEQYLRHSKLTNDVNNTQNLPHARLNFEDIKPADRATYLLNYLYLQIQSDQLLLDNLQGLGNEKLNTLKECFLTCLKPYLEILNDWVCKGDDDLSTHDLKNEFFIKANHRLFVGHVDEEENQSIHSQNSRKQWSESYVFRTINISKLLGRAMRKAKGAGAMGNLVNMLDQNNDGNEDDEILNKKAARDHVEISCPIFLRPLMKQILSVGKSIKIVRYLENIDMYKTKSKPNNNAPDSLQMQDNPYKQGIDYEKLSQQNVKQIKAVIENIQNDLDALEKTRRCSPIDYMNANRDMPSFQIETIAKNFISHEDEQNNEMDESAVQRHQQELLLQIAPFQMTHQYENTTRKEGEDDVEMRDDNEKEDALSKLRNDSQVEQIDQQFFGVFKMPQVIKSYEANEANDQYHDEIKKVTSEKVQQIANQQTVYNQLTGGIVGQETEWNNRIVGANGGSGNSNYSTDENSPKDDKLIVFGNNKPASSLVIGDKCKKIESLQKQEFFDFAQQELSIYDKSMRQYQSQNAFEYYLSDQKNKGQNVQNTLSSTLPSQLSFRHLTLETYLYDSILMPIQGIFRSTSLEFLNKYLMSSTPQYCQLQDQLTILHKVYFLQGVAMQKFLGGLFDKIDESINHQSSMANQLYLINGNFQECLAEMLSGHGLANLNARNIKANMNVEVEDGLGTGAGANGVQRKSKLHARSSDFLQSIKVVYNCEWPVEVVIDKLTIVHKYNRIFKLLIHIKFAKYLMQKRDYHIREPNLLKTTKHYTYAKNYSQEIEEMGARERLTLQNKVMLGQLMHQLQMFQGELLHFITTMEDYFMNRATQLECRKLIQEIHKMRNQGHDKSAQQQPVQGSAINIEPVIDLDDIIELHDSYIGRILQLCLLDTKSQELLRYILEIVDICQDFRKLIKYYLLSDDFDNMSDDDDAYSRGNQPGHNDSYDMDPATSKSRSRKIEDKFTGMGLLSINSSNFVQNVDECSEKLNQMRTQYEKHMLVLTTNLNKLTKTQSGKIILSYLLEILQRLNFNSYYVSRENEGLPPVGYYN